MTLSPEIVDAIQKAEHKALATFCGEVNVVPVSVLEIVDGDIWLFNFFMDKTAKNICAEPSAALALWRGMEGVQLKGKVTHEESGENFDRAKAKMKEKFPERTIKGLLIFKPESVYDLTPGAGGRKLQ